MGGSGLTFDLFLGGIIMVVFLVLLLLKEYASASENPEWQRIGNWLYLPIIPLLFLFFLLAGYRALFVLGLLTEPSGETPTPSEPVAAASETTALIEPLMIDRGSTRNPAASESLEPTALHIFTPTVTKSPTPLSINPSATIPPSPTRTQAPAPTATPEPEESEPTPEPTETEPPPSSPVPSSTPPSPNPTPTTAPTDSGEPPGTRLTPTPAPAPF